MKEYANWDLGKVWEDANQERWTGEQKADYCKTLMNTRVSNLPWIKTATGLAKNPRDSKIQKKMGGRRGWLQREKYSGNMHRGDRATKPWKSRESKNSKGKIMTRDKNKTRFGHLLRWKSFQSGFQGDRWCWVEAGEWRGEKNGCERDRWIKEVKRDGTTTGITEESRRLECSLWRGECFWKGN